MKTAAQDKYQRSRNLLLILQGKAKKPNLPPAARRTIMALVRKQKAIVKAMFRFLGHAKAQ